MRTAASESTSRTLLIAGDNPLQPLEDPPGMAGLLFARRSTQHTTTAHVYASNRARGLRTGCAYLHDAARHRDVDPRCDDLGHAGDGKPDHTTTDIDALTHSVSHSVDRAVAIADRGVIAERAGSRSRIVLRGRRCPHAEPRIRAYRTDLPRLDQHADRFLRAARSGVRSHRSVATRDHR